MSTFADLIEVAYKKERTNGRRLAKKLGISEEDALRKGLKAKAGDQSLASLIEHRRREAADSTAKAATSKHAKAVARARKLAATLPDPNAWLAWFDGAAHPNPGKMGIGGLLKNPDGELVTRISYAAGQGDSSEAEYLALLAILQAAVTARAQKLIIYGDSRVVLDDIQTETTGASILRHYRTQARLLLTQLNDVTFIWIPRKKNSMADALSQQAIKRSSINLAS